MDIHVAPKIIDFFMSILPTPFRVQTDKTSNFVDLFSSFFNRHVFKWLHVKVRFHQVIFHIRTFEKKSGKWRAINALVVTKPATAVTSTDTWVHAEWKLTADHANTPVAQTKSGR